MTLSRVEGSGGSAKNRARFGDQTSLRVTDPRSAERGSVSRSKVRTLEGSGPCGGAGSGGGGACSRDGAFGCFLDTVWLLGVAASHRLAILERGSVSRSNARTLKGARMPQARADREIQSGAPR
jgi:hypothetical protein